MRLRCWLRRTPILCRSRLFQVDGWRDGLGEGERGHGVGLDELVVGSGGGEDEMRSNAGLELSNAFEGAFALLRRGGSVWQGGSSEDDDGVEVVEAGVCGWDTEISE